MTAKTSADRAKRRVGAVLIVLILLTFAALAATKAGWRAGSAATSDAAVVVQHTTSASKPSQSRADASVAYESALASGKPIYLLFHSLTCDPCIEISAVVDKVVPTYKGRVAFVNAITDDASAQQLASRFQFQYIPQSFFIDSKGSVVDSHTGVIDEPSMRARLDRLVAQ